MGIALVILGIACVSYGIAVLRVSSGTGFFMVWFALAAVLLVAGCAVLSGAWGALPLAVQYGIEAVAVLAVVGLLVAILFIMRHFGDTGKPDLDCIIVLGAQIRTTGPSIVLRRRLETAAGYLAANPRTNCVVTGGQGYNEPESEASAMARFLVERGISANRIILEDRSTSTRENFAFSRDLIGPGHASIGVVTNNFHMSRALLIARAQGFEGIVGIAAPSSLFFLPNNLLRESLAIAKALLQNLL